MVCKQCQSLIAEGGSACLVCGASVEQRVETDPLIGRTLLNQYVIQKKLGEGGFGAVYLAEQPSMGRKVAIKTLHRHLTHNKNVVARFRREGMAASKLEHPYAVKMHNLGETEDGLLWMAMEFLSGETIEAKLRRKGTMSPEALVELMGPICAVLQEAHDKGIIHRDLKPENLMLITDLEGKQIPKILDFGIAALLDEGERTQTGVISGTPKYMSPEQWRGLKHTDRRSDIYSLGVIAYQCLSGKLPFQADSVPGWMQQHCLEPPMELAEVQQERRISAAFCSVIMRAIEKDPNKRPQSAKEFVESLRRAKESGAATIPESPIERSAALVAKLAESVPANSSDVVALSAPTKSVSLDEPLTSSDPTPESKSSNRGLLLGVVGGLGLAAVVFVTSTILNTKPPAKQLSIQPINQPAYTTPASSEPAFQPNTTSEVTEGKADIKGALDKEIISHVVRRAMPGIKFCYDQALTQNPGLGGKVKIFFVIAPNGAVSSASPTSGIDSAVDACVARKIARLSFPSPQGGGIVEVTYPFLFQSVGAIE